MVLKKLPTPVRRQIRESSNYNYTQSTSFCMMIYSQDKLSVYLLRLSLYVAYPSFANRRRSWLSNFREHNYQLGSRICTTILLTRSPAHTSA